MLRCLALWPRGSGEPLPGDPGKTQWRRRSAAVSEAGTLSGSLPVSCPARKNTQRNQGRCEFPRHSSHVALFNIVADHEDLTLSVSRERGLSSSLWIGTPLEGPLACRRFNAFPPHRSRILRHNSLYPSYFGGQGFTAERILRRGCSVPTGRPRLLYEQFECGGRDLFDEEVLLEPHFALFPSVNHRPDHHTI